MFLSINYRSVNTPADIRAKALEVVCSQYANQGVGLMAQLFEYANAETGEMLFKELVTVDAAGAVRAHDYVLLPNGNWRDSYGEVNSNAAALLPVELGAAQLVSRQELGQFSMEGMNV